MLLSSRYVRAARLLILLLDRLIRNGEDADLVLVDRVGLEGLSRLAYLDRRLGRLFSITLGLDLLDYVAVTYCIRLYAGAVSGGELLYVEVFPRAGPISRTLRLDILVPMAFRIMIVSGRLRLE